ncbi:cytochrome b N-terminal domain-containing protein [Desulfosediminicola ganghwensis]|uniref:cytochrome b N-terminal domain-containing protein n=1 Tax=Desulfosediminicola ganghwensis TaxID=2569540 RepID=UPI0010AC6ADC|nr:cytochrome b N-terminal domain-containing protein [Desulfosediminicola ganghwensis]
MTDFQKVLLQRIGWDVHLKPFLYKKLPTNLGWSVTLGSLCVMLFVLLAVTGMFLAMYYSPSPDKAYQSIEYIMNDVPMGDILRGIHHWGAGAMVLAVCLHLYAVFFNGSFKAPRELTWIVGVFLLFATLGLGFTGYLLPWDQKAYWATVVATAIPGDIPVVGEGITSLILGGQVSGFTITRFYAIHMLVLPTVMIVLIAAHIYLVRLHGVSDHKPKAKGELDAAANHATTTKLYRFYPEHCGRSTLVFIAVFGAIIYLSIFADIPKEGIVGTVDESYLPRPEWYFMWIFQLLTFFSGSTEVIGSLGIPTLCAVVLLGLPFIEKSKHVGMAKRPLATAVGVSSAVVIVYLTITAFAAARDYGGEILLPERNLTETENAGLQIYVKQDCAYCHQTSGEGGRRVGPDMARLNPKGRTKEYLAAYVKDPQAQSSFSIMPKYPMKQDELDALAEFMLALDFRDNAGRLIEKREVLEQGKAKESVSLVTGH